MIELNLTATTAEQKVLKEYLQNNASETLAEKINNGVRIVKDGIPLINKKNLDSFMKYACDEAKNQAVKGANSACIHSDTVFNWVIHYFEEDSIEGILYNNDGSEYKPQKHKYEPKATPTPITPPKPQPQPQLSLFDMLEMTGNEKTVESPIDIEDTEKTEDSEDDCFTEEEQDEIMQELSKEEIQENVKNLPLEEKEKELLTNSLVNNAITTKTDNQVINNLTEILGNIFIER